MSKFLDDLKDAADNGEFNSDAAKKINEVGELADDLANEKSHLELMDSLQERIKKDAEANPDTVKISEEEALELNTQYEGKMLKLKQVDAANAQLATLIEIEDMVIASIDDMLGHVEELETQFTEVFKKENPVYGDLSQKIEAIKSKYKL